MNKAALCLRIKVISTVAGGFCFGRSSRNFLAEFYLAQGKKAEAIEEFRRALADPGPSDYAPEFREEHEKARARLKEVAP